MKTAEIKELIAIFNESDITELVLELDNLKLHLSKLKVSAPQQAAQHVPQPSATAGTKEAEPQQPSQEQPAKLREVLAPMVGVFYRAPSPGADPYVEVGSFVEKGQTLCIIEAMKLMNEIESEYRGQVVEILVENGQPVEYGQPLFLIEPAE
ncbi:MAG: acetyl-CoA carboxylase biotin carboxyl carrier protein [Limnochordia bacterium]|jgi:acetyl-CoA carboxylase biotin carboxyl carrier protein|nr:acetyl-CoA carboxylase biotin carboxyl carrier protein [Bacillota bacterium]HOB08078.1 acetyl-CoA carboxylase biotin carboxyl carrier protein [Limnochordia bacterium]NLH32273.1 acetyl-CoA carboxylase biotin carboxyl carrier protein [Bacillota bacterium]HPT92449.1 acetyl-CoA carboxylase biotin carboxyl carrier protein [Limnochordia bacterium]HPZ30227.1 acetyl-CoA carboxylase biotin carboxyl carrier protein [Limnochordia bacterium]